MQSLERNGYSEQEIRDMLLLKSGSRIVRFRYDLLDKEENKKGELNRVSGGSVSMSAFSNIKRTAKFTLEDEKIETRAYFTWQDMSDKKWSEI